MIIDQNLRELSSFFRIDDDNWWDLFNRALPPDVIDAALTATAAHEKRVRKLTARTMLLLVIAMNLFTEESIEQVLAAMTEGIRFLNPHLDGNFPKKGASAKPDTDSAPRRRSTFSTAFAVLSPPPRRLARSSSDCA